MAEYQQAGYIGHPTMAAVNTEHLLTNWAAPDQLNNPLTPFRATGCSEGSSQMTGESRISKAAWRSKGLLSCHELCPEPLLLFLYLFSTSSPLSLRSYECEQRLVEEPN